MQYDCVWYWKGGREVGQWRDASFITNAAQDLTIKHLEQAGYVAKKGSRSIGPPEGPPRDEEFVRLGL